MVKPKNFAAFGAFNEVFFQGVNVVKTKNLGAFGALNEVFISGCTMENQPFPHLFYIIVYTTGYYTFHAEM